MKFLVDSNVIIYHLNTRSRIPLPRRKPGGGQANYEVAFGRFACDLRLCSIVP
jgi:hypothetical protein